MIQVIILGVIAIITLYSLSKLNRVSEKNLKIFSAISLLLTVLFVYIELDNDNYRERVQKLTLQYTQDQNISCGEHTVNQTHYNMASNSFIAKQSSKDRGVIIPFKECKTD
jgi:hypothetical protein